MVAQNRQAHRELAAIKTCWRYFKITLRAILSATCWLIRKTFLVLGYLLLVLSFGFLILLIIRHPITVFKHVLTWIVDKVVSKFL